MGTLPRKIDPQKIKGYVVAHEKVFLAYDPEDGKEWREIVLAFGVEDEEDKIKLLALIEIFIKGFRSGMIKREEGCLPTFHLNAPYAQRKALQVLLQHIMDNQDDVFALRIVTPLVKKYSLAKPKYMTKQEINTLATKLGMKSI